MSNLPHKIKYFSERYLIIIIVFFAFILRFKGIDFGLPYLYHPDEHELMNPAINMVFTGDLNPHIFNFPGSFIMYLMAILFVIILGVYFIYCFLHGHVYDLNTFGKLVKNNPTFYFDSNPVLFYYIGRLLMVIFAIITIYLVYLTAKKIFSKSVSLLASFCLTISPLHIEHSRYVRPDIPATMLIMFSIYFLLEYFEKNKNKKLLILSSLFAGFSIAAKYPSGIIILPILVYCLVADFKHTKLFTVNYMPIFFRVKANLSKALLFIFIGFFVFAPFVIFEFRHSIRDMAMETKGTHLSHERLPGLQNHLWYLENPLQKGIGGLFFEIFAGLGLCIAFLKKSFKKYLFLIFPVLYYIVIVGLGRLRWSRWLIPVLPFEAILFGFGFYSCYKYFTQIRAFQWFKPAIIFIFAVVLFFSSSFPIIDNAKAAMSLSRTDTRTITKDWVEGNLPRGSKIAYEYYAPHLHINPRGDFVLINMDWRMIVYQPLSYYENALVDYIIITDNFKNRFYNEPGKYTKEISRYEELKNRATLIKVFNLIENPGPVIEIYKLRQHSQSVPN